LGGDPSDQPGSAKLAGNIGQTAKMVDEVLALYRSAEQSGFRQVKE